MRNLFNLRIALSFLLFILGFIWIGYSAVYAAANIDEMVGSRIPKDTVVTASSTYLDYDVSRALDHDLSTYWNAKSANATIDFNFPHSVSLNTVQIAAVARPATQFNYTIYGLKDKKWVEIGSSILKVPAEEVVILDPIPVTSGTYDGVRITGGSTSTWMAISEISIGSSVITPFHLKAEGKDKQATLTWDKVELADSYVIKYGLESGKYTESVIASKSEFEKFVISGLTSGNTYYFVVSAVQNGIDSDYSNEASVKLGEVNTPDVPAPDILGNRAILVVTLDTGLQKEFDLNITEVNDFINWYETKQAGSGKAAFAVNKHNNNKGPFSSRKDYIIFNRILNFEVNEY
ncbi:fibronectin type III domain-containing protein [Paenibacillus kyungheensis]